MTGATFTGPGGQDPLDHFKTIILKTQPTEAEALLAGQYLRGQIRRRTFADEDLRGGNFIPYSPSYTKQKGQTNVDLYSRGAGKHMLDALMVKAGMSQSDGNAGIQGSNEPADHVELGVFGDEKMAARARIHDLGGEGRTRQGTGTHIAKRHSRKFGADIRRQKKGGKGLFTMPQRKWLGATLEDIEEMRRLIVEAITNRLNGF